MVVKTWKPQPLNTVVIELLQRKGPVNDTELHSMVKDILGDVGFDVLNKELLRLEIGGLIQVSTLTKGRRRVELLKTKGKEEGKSHTIR
jgi:hypothetical protein